MSARVWMKIVVVIAMTSMATVLAAAEVDQEDERETAPQRDMLTPLYYLSTSDSPFRIEMDRFVSAAREESFHHPLQDESGRAPHYRVREMGRFGAGKGPGGDKEHHPAVDLHIGNGDTDVAMYAAHGGRVSTFRDAPKYRQYLAITEDVKAENGEVLGRIVTIYAHVDLDLDEAAGLSMNGKMVREGDLVSRHLYPRTRGGPHLHFEIRYYRPDDKGSETFYGFRFPGRLAGDLTRESVKPWSYGYWNPGIGYGFADPRNHGLTCY